MGCRDANQHASASIQVYNMYGIAIEVVSRNKDKQNFWNRGVGVNNNFAWEEKKFRLFLFFIYALSYVVKNKGFLCTKKPLNFIIMSLWDWLLAAWIYEEIFDDDSKERLHEKSFDNSLRDYDYDDFDDFWQSRLPLNNSVT